MTAGLLIVALCGHAGAGKDTAAMHLALQHDFQPYAFATPLRRMLTSLMTSAGVSHDYITDRELKEKPIPGLGFSYRQLVQTLGTEWGRNTLASDFWLRVAIAQLGLREGPKRRPLHSRICITDLRFPNEADWVQAQGGQVVRIFREAPAVREHESEDHVDRIVPWGRIDNTGDLPSLHAQLDAMVERLINLPRHDEGRAMKAQP